MCTYLKNIEGKKPKDLKNKSFDFIHKMFDRAFKRVNTFVDFRTYLVEGSLKRAGEELEQESTKKQKVDEDKDTAELQSLMEVISDEEEVVVDVVPLDTKPPTIEDLEDLYKLVKAKYKSTRLVKDLDLVLWSDLKTMFEPHVEDEIWKLQQKYQVLSWKIFDLCRVHCLSLQSGMIYMLIEKRYPLTLSIIIDMLNKKLQGRIVGIKSLLNAVSITAALIDVNAAQSKLVLLENFNGNYSKCLRLLYKVNVAEGVNVASEEVSTAELVSDLDNSTNNVLIPLDSWTSGLLVYRLPLSVEYGVSSSLSNTAYSSQQINTTYPLPLDTAYRSSGTETKIIDFRKIFFYLPSEQILLIVYPLFQGSDNEDANEHIEKVLEIVDLFHVPNITVDQLMLRVFPISLTGAASRWLRNEPTGAVPTKTAADAKTPIQEMAEYSQKWHNGTSRGRSTETSDGLAAGY
ncbi:hypothetical protein Tco_0441728 [Tanacetum coccineum]